MAFKGKVYFGPVNLFSDNLFSPPPHTHTHFIPLFQEKRLCAHPFLEIYRDGQIHFMAPLARQGDFYVPEVRRVERRSLKKELHSDSEVSGINFMLLSTINLNMSTQRTSENYQWNFKDASSKSGFVPPSHINTNINNII